MARDKTTIEVTTDTWRELNQRKNPGESFNDVLQRLLTGDEESSSPEPAPAPEPTPEPVDVEPDDSLRDRAERRLEELDVPGRPMRVERTRRKAILYAWSRLRKEQSMKPKRLANDTFGQFWDDSDLNYSTSGSRYPGYQLWDSCVRDVLRELPGVVDNSPEWMFDETAV